MSASMRTCFPTRQKLSAYTSSIRNINLSATFNDANHAKTLSACACCHKNNLLENYETAQKSKLTLKSKKCRDRKKVYFLSSYSARGSDRINFSNSNTDSSILSHSGRGFYNYNQIAQFSSGVQGINGDEDDAIDDDHDDDDGPLIDYPMNTLTTMSPPDIFPNVPVLAISRTPLFPNFMKQIVVSIHSNLVYI